MAQTVVIEGLPEFRRALKKYAPEVAKEFNKESRAVAVRITTVARENASWSRRIPGAIKPSVTAKGVGVRVVKKIAPHGGLYERGGSGDRSGSFRHPVFGNRDVWVTSPTRPFLRPAVEANRDEAMAAMLRAIENAKTKVGLHG